MSHPTSQPPKIIDGKNILPLTIAVQRHHMTQFKTDIKLGSLVVNDYIAHIRAIIRDYTKESDDKATINIFDYTDESKSLNLIPPVNDTDLQDNAVIDIFFTIKPQKITNHDLEIPSSPRLTFHSFQLVTPASETTPTYSPGHLTELYGHAETAKLFYKSYCARYVVSTMNPFSTIPLTYTQITLNAAISDSPEGKFPLYLRRYPTNHRIISTAVKIMSITDCNICGVDCELIHTENQKIQKTLHTSKFVTSLDLAGLSGQTVLLRQLVDFSSGTATTIRPIIMTLIVPGNADNMIKSQNELANTTEMMATFFWTQYEESKAVPTTLHTISSFPTIHIDKLAMGSLPLKDKPLVVRALISDPPQLTKGSGYQILLHDASTHKKTPITLPPTYNCKIYPEFEKINFSNESAIFDIYFGIVPDTPEFRQNPLLYPAHSSGQNSNGSLAVFRAMKWSSTFDKSDALQQFTKQAEFQRLRCEDYYAKFCAADLTKELNFMQNPHTTIPISYKSFSEDIKYTRGSHKVTLHGVDVTNRMVSVVASVEKSESCSETDHGKCTKISLKDSNSNSFTHHYNKHQDSPYLINAPSCGAIVSSTFVITVAEDAPKCQLTSQAVIDAKPTPEQRIKIMNSHRENISAVGKMFLTTSFDYSSFLLRYFIPIVCALYAYFFMPMNGQVPLLPDSSLP